MKNVIRILAITALVVVMMISSVFAAEDGVDWNANMITATGSGVAPTNARSAAQARIMARRAAIVDAYRQLAETAKGVNIDGSTTVENGMIMQDVTSSKVSAFVQGARVVSERVAPDGAYEVTMQAPLFGVNNSLAGAVFEKPSTKEAFPSATVNSDTSSATYTTTAGQERVYTGLVVDCRGLGLKPVMSPVIKNANGEPIYGYKNLDYDKVVSNGMAGYAYDLNTATRAGARPLVVKAQSLDGNNANPVVSVADANKILLENQATHFLDNTGVVFLR